MRSSIVLILVLFLAGIAVAQSEEESAPEKLGDRLWTEGKGLLEKGEPEAALGKFREARTVFEKIPNPQGVCWMHAWSAKALEALGKHEEALAEHRAHVAGLVAAQGEGDHLHLAESRNNLASSLDALGRPAEALPLYLDSLAMYRRLVGDGHPVVVTVTGNVGFCLGKLGRHKQALACHLQALGLARKVFEGDHPALALCLSNLGLCLQELGRGVEALPLQHEALEMRRRLHPEDHPEVEVSLNNVGSCLNALGRTWDAVEWYEKALEMARRLYPPGHPELSRGLNNIAHCWLELGQGGEALPLFLEAREVARNAFSGDHPLVASATNNLGYCLMLLGRTPEALVLFEEALAMRRRCFSGDHPSIALSLNNLAGCLQTLGRAEESEPYHREALAMTLRLFGPDHPGVVSSLVNVAGCCTSLGKHEAALGLYRRAVALAGRVHDGDHPDSALALSNLAACLGGLGKEVLALPLLRKTLAMRRRLFPGDHPAVAKSLNNLGWCLRNLGRAEEAIPLLEEAVAMARRISSPEFHFWAANLGWVRLADGKDPAPAAALFAEAIAQLEEIRAGAAGLEERDRGTYFGKLKVFQPFEGMARAQIRSGRPDEALRFIERGRARSLLDLLDRSRFDPMQELRRDAEAAEDAKLLAEIDGAVADLELLDRRVALLSHHLAVVRSRADLSEAEKRKAIEIVAALLATEREGRTKAIRRCARIVGDHLEMTRPAPPEAIQRLLGKGQRLLLYSVSHADSWLLLVPPPGEKITAHPLSWPDGSPVTHATLVTAVREYVDALVQSGRSTRGLGVPGGEGKTAASPSSVGAKLFRGLVPEAVWQEIRGLDRVAVVPHGPLHRLPFETLVVNAGEDAAKTVYWLDSGPAIAYAASGSAFEWSRRRGEAQARRRGPTSVIALGDPVFTRSGKGTESAERSGRLSRYGGLDPLPGTRREVEALGKSLTKDAAARITLLLGEEATESRLFALAPRAKILHIATHQLLDETEAASYSSLALTLPAAPTVQDDGFLTLTDLLLHWRGRLRGCELVVLSACETQRGRLQIDEGVYSMPWGFMFAGSPSVIASLWQVNDASTAEMMAAFYKGLDSGDRLEAFTSARRALRERFPEPYFWAPFIYLGDS